MEAVTARMEATVTAADRSLSESREFRTDAGCGKLYRKPLLCRGA